MPLSQSVFVRSISKRSNDTTVVEASNGSPEGPPFVRFYLPPNETEKCHIGKRYKIIIEEEPCP